MQPSRVTCTPAGVVRHSHGARRWGHARMTSALLFNLCTMATHAVCASNKGSSWLPELLQEAFSKDTTDFILRWVLVRFHVIMSGCRMVVTLNPSLSFSQVLHVCIACTSGCGQGLCADTQAMRLTHNKMHAPASASTT